MPYPRILVWILNWKISVKRKITKKSECIFYQHMREFAEKYSDANYAAAAAQIPWGHNMLLLDKIGDLLVQLDKSTTKNVSAKGREKGPRHRGRRPGAGDERLSSPSPLGQGKTVAQAKGAFRARRGRYCVGPLAEHTVWRSPSQAQGDGGGQGVYRLVPDTSISPPLPAPTCFPFYQTTTT